jgi:hypothetical protein
MMPVEAVGAAVFIETISQKWVVQTRTEGGLKDRMNENKGGGHGTGRPTESLLDQV